MVVRVSARSATDEDLIADLARVAALTGSRNLTRAEYALNGKWHPATIHRRLGWAAACKRAGLESGRPDLGHSNEAWLANIYDVWITRGRQPSYNDMRGSRFSAEGYARRYGSWTGALLAFQNWLDAGEHTALPTPSRSAIAARAQVRAPSLRLRFAVLQRDRFTCVACGSSPATDPGTILHVDHVIPFSKGGKTDVDNLQTLCDRCNYGKADQG
jgi:hypothetical protein